MSSQPKKNTDELSVAETARRARSAACLLATVPGAVRDAALRAAAAALEGHTSEILHANQLDCDDAAHNLQIRRPFSNSMRGGRSLSPSPGVFEKENCYW